MARSRSKQTGLVTVRHYGQVATIDAGELASWEASGWVADEDAPVPAEPAEG